MSPGLIIIPGSDLDPSTYFGNGETMGANVGVPEFIDRFPAFYAHYLHEGGSTCSVNWRPERLRTTPENASVTLHRTFRPEFHLRPMRSFAPAETTKPIRAGKNYPKRAARPYSNVYLLVRV